MRSSGVRLLSCLALAGSLVAAGPAGAAQCPSVMLVLDASGSMLQDPSGRWPEDPGFKGPSKWELLQQCVADLIKEVGGRMPIGLMIYSGGGTEDATCAANCSVQVPISHSSSSEILTQMRDTKPEREAQTPTNGAIRVARMDPGLHVAGLKQNILLVTDGDPNCGSDRRYADIDTHIISSDIAQYPGTVLGELDQAFRQSPSIRTYVVGFTGAGLAVQNLENMGYYGGDRRMGCGSGDTQCFFPLDVGGPSCGQIFNTITAQIVGEFMQDCQNTCEGGVCPPGEVCVSTEQNPTKHCAPAGVDTIPPMQQADCQCRLGAAPRGGSLRAALLGALVLGALLRPRLRRRRQRSV